MSKQAAGQLIIDIDPPKPAPQIIDPEPETQALERVPANPIDLLTLAIERNVDVEKLQALVEMERQWRADKAKAEYDAALARFGELKRTVQHNRKGKTAGGAEYGYADYPTMVRAISPWLAECGLSFTHRKDPPVVTDGKISFVMVYCQIRHAAGHREEYPCAAIPDGRLEGKVSPVQLLQLATTYAKRQSLAEGLGLATAEDRDDDDSQGHKAKELITDKQAADLLAKIEEVGADKPLFLKYFKIEKLEDLPLSEYQKALKTLEQKAKAKK